ncbi:MAG: MBL fold metallo-hydrolase [Bacillota bacterium]
MKLTVLGCWAPYPRAGGACSGYLIHDRGMNILIDCGNGVLSALQKHLDFRQLDAVIISHLHPDHYLDLYSLRHAIAGSIRDGSRREKLGLYLPGLPEEAFEPFLKYTDAFKIINFKDLPIVNRRGFSGEVRAVEAGPLNITAARVHHPLPTYSIAVEGSARFVYSADTKNFPGLAEWARGADLFLCEASVQEAEKDYTEVGHLTAREAGEVAARAGVRKLIITHFWPEYDLTLTAREAAEGFGRRVIVAREGKTYSVGR